MRVYGTDRFSGLNTQTAEHLLDASVLRQADNVNYDIFGAVSPEKEDASPSGVAVTNVDGIGCAYRGGVKYYYKVTSAGSGTVYEYNGTLATTVGGSWGDERLRVVQLDDGVLLFDGEDVKAWDGSVLRDAGPLVGTDDYGVTSFDYPYVSVGAATSKTVDDITESSGTITVTTSTGHGLTTGDVVYISDVVGAFEEINNRTYTVTVTTTTAFTLDEIDGSGWSGGTVTAGNVYDSGSGLDGVYRYWVTYRVTLPSGKVIESSLEAIPDWYQRDSESVDIDPSDRAVVAIKAVATTDVTGYLSGTYTPGTDLTVQARIWRSKAAGATPYLLTTIEHADIYDVDSGVVNAVTYTDTTADDGLGEEWLERLAAHDAPPEFEIACVHKNRVYAVDVDSPTSLRWSGYGQPDYWHPQDEVLFPEDIQAVTSVGDYLVVMSRTRCWLYTNDDGIGYLEEVRVPLGVSSAEALQGSQNAAYFGNDLGLWRLSGRSVELLSAPVDDDWREAGGGAWAGAMVGDKMVWACDTGSADKAFVLKMSGGDIFWGRTDQDSDGDYELFAPDPWNRRFFCQRSDGIYFFGGGTVDKTMTVATREFGDGRLTTLVGAVIEGSSDLDGEVNVTGNHESLPSVQHIEGNGRGRTVCRLKFPALQGEYWRLSFTGTGTVYGMWLEVDGRDGRNP